MLKKILTKMAKEVYPERDISVEKLGGRFFLHPRDTTGCNTYLLEGTYSYDEVVKLNALTTYSAGFGFCSELGPIAFRGRSEEFRKLYRVWFRRTQRSCISSSYKTDVLCL